MSSNPLVPSFRVGFNLPGPVGVALRSHDNSITDLNQAIVTLKSQIDGIKAGSGTSTSTTEEVSSNSVTSVTTNTTSAGGTVNNQIGNTSYTTVPNDNGAVILLSDASPIAVTLNSMIVVFPYYTFVVNYGVGIVTLTPSSGTISYGSASGASSMPLDQGYFAILFFDGTNWWACSLPIAPLSAGPTANEWIASYDAGTGVFTLSQPAFDNISGTATATQVPIAGSITGQGALATESQANLATQVTGILPVANGGTGSSTIPTWNQNTTGTAATATELSTNGSSGEVWSMTSASTQGWAAAGTSVSNIQITVGTSAIAANSAGTVTVVSMPGLTTSMTVSFTPTSDVSTVTGWSPSSPGLYFSFWPSAAGELSYYVCNLTGASITPSASTTWNVSAQ